MPGGASLARILTIVSFVLTLGSLALLPDRAAAASGWQIVLDRPTPTFGSVDFVSDTEGWMPAGAGLLHTTDGGATWVENARLTVGDVDFFDQQHGWAVGPTRASSTPRTVVKTGASRRAVCTARCTSLMSRRLALRRAGRSPCWKLATYRRSQTAPSFMLPMRAKPGSK